LARTTYADCNDRHCWELLREREDLTVSREVVRQLRRAAGLAPKRTRRAPRHRRRRPRRPARGLLVLWDGSPHAWFGPAQPSCTLMAAVDDATGELLAALFTPAESSVAYLRLLQALVTTHGIPVAIYQDRHSALIRTDPRRTLAEQFAEAPQPTQVGAALRALGIEPIFALSPQAKGRIERAFGTLQDRLVPELALAGLTTLDAANAWLPTTFLPRYNARVARPPQEVTPAFRPVPHALDLPRVLSLAYAATVGNDNAVRLGATLVVDIPPGPRGRSYAKARVEVRQLLDASWRVYYHDRLIATAPPTALADGSRRPRRRWTSDDPADTPAPHRQPGDIFMWPLGGQIDVV
jgi:hypothetical protein